jgi:hypothetical protein
LHFHFKAGFWHHAGVVYMNMNIRALYALLWVQLCFGHVCIIDPPQRGILNVTDPGDHWCFNSGPKVADGLSCGDKTRFPVGTPRKWVAGSKVTIQFQQNLNHYNAGFEGFLDVGYSSKQDPTEVDFITLETIRDTYQHKQAAQTNYSVTFTVPNATTEAGVLRVRYHPNKPTEPVFRNCADVSIVSADANMVQAANTLIAFQQPASGKAMENNGPQLVQAAKKIQPFKTSGVKGMTLADGIVAVDRVNQEAYFLAQLSFSGGTEPADQLLKFQLDGQSFSHLGVVTAPARGQWCSILQRGPSLLGVAQVQNSDGKFFYQVNHITTDGTVGQVVAKTTPETDFVNFMWAEYNAATDSVSILAGDENTLYKLDGWIHTFDLQKRTVHSFPLDVSKYTFSAFHASPDGSLYAVSPGLITADSIVSEWSVVTVDAMSGNITAAAPLVSEGTSNWAKFDTSFSGNVAMGFNNGKLWHVLVDPGLLTQVLLAIDPASGKFTPTPIGGVYKPDFVALVNFAAL